ncbi:MAG: hypothetical protein SXV54_28215, partial [Chloroflexota bacterium]|nr:hypothetical protein [Chloroflexota bacterium]
VLLLVPVALIVLRRCVLWAPLIAILSWGSLLLPYRVQMTMIPLAVCGLLLVTWREPLETGASRA